MTPPRSMSTQSSWVALVRVLGLVQVLVLGLVQVLVQVRGLGLVRVRGLGLPRPQPPPLCVYIWVATRSK